jgi:hypothetical protein
MFRKIICAGLIIVWAWGGAAGQAAADDVVLIPRGRQASMTFSNLVSVAVGDVNISYILERKGDKVIICGDRVGETSLEVVQRGASKKVFKVRVVSGAVAEGKGRETAAASAAPHIGGAVETSTAAAMPESSSQMKTPTPSADPVPHESHGSSAATPDHVADAPAVARVSPKRVDKSPGVAAPLVERGPGKLSLSRFEVTAETSVSVDTETYNPVDAEAVTAQARDGAEAGAAKVGGAKARQEAAVELRAKSVKVRRSSVTVPVTVRYEINDRNSVSFVMPFIKRRDEVKIGGETFKSSAQGLGDVQLNFTREFTRLHKTGWDGNLSVNVGLPTARSIYNATADKAPLGIGHVELGNVMGVRRVFDPLVFNAAFGLSYLVPRNVNGEKVKPGLGQSFQTGVAYALHDRWAISEQLYYARQPNYFLNTPTDDRTSSTEQAYLNHILVFNPKGNGGHTMRMSFNLGLTNSSTDYGFLFSYSLRRKPAQTQ